MWVGRVHVWAGEGGGHVSEHESQGSPKIALRGGDGMGARRRRGGGFQKWASVPGPLFCVRTVVATKGAGTQILARKIFSLKNFPPHMCSQNDQRDVGIILSHTCWGRTPPPPGTAGRAAPAQTPLPARRPRRGRGGLGKWASVQSPPCKAIFFPPSSEYHSPTRADRKSVGRPLGLYNGEGHSREAFGSSVGFQ